MKERETPLSVAPVLHSPIARLAGYFFGKSFEICIDANQFCAILTCVVNATATASKRDTKMKVSNQDFAAAKKAVKKVGTADVSLATRVAIEVLTARCPQASVELIADMAWQVVLAARY